jgi:hypothetical protein
MRKVRFATIGMVALAAACASGGGGGVAEVGPSDRSLLTAQDLALYPTDNLYDSVRRLRRFWLQGSGGGLPRVFVDGVEVGGGRDLREYSSGMVLEVRFIQPVDAMTQFGLDYAGGVIQVTLRNPPFLESGSSLVFLVESVPEGRLEA